jgi:hypothetical protein
MRLTIIIPDSAVYKDGISYLPLTWEGTPENVRVLQWFDISGWIEYSDGTLNEDITELPQWAYNAIASWDVANAPILPKPPTAEDNKAFASLLLIETDWTTIADVASPINSPYLANQAEFISYRNLVRQIAVNPIDGDIDFPIKPSCLWVCNK